MTYYHLTVQAESWNQFIWHFQLYSAFYPILLICLTWLCIELHDRNGFRPLVWLWRPFHRCFVWLWRSWDTKGDIIDVFTTVFFVFFFFFIFSYSKILYQTVLTSITNTITNINEAGRIFEERKLLILFMEVHIFLHLQFHHYLFQQWTFYHHYFSS